MMNSPRNLLSALFAAFLLLLSPAFGAYAQTHHNITLQVKDAANDEPVGFATVSLSVPGSSASPKYALSDGDGKAILEKVRPGKYQLKVEILGYKTLTKDVEVTKEEDLGIFKMETDQQVLDAASVSATGNPIIIKKDTVEYNASSFKTTENDMLVDLLKKLPGIEVSEDGSITSNGETINKITIEGKTFFLDDPQLATQNLPAKIINKVKVVKKKSEQAEFTGIDDGNDETVIDLSVKKGMMKGLFGNVMAGGGHDLTPEALKKDTWKDADYWRYQGAAMVGRFTDKSQISFIANANNTNNRGFNDLSGSMMSAMRGGSGGGGGMGRGQGGWGGNNGISTTWMGGLNGAWTLLDGNMDLSGNYVYNGSDKLVKESSLKDTYLGDGNTLSYRTGTYVNGNDLDDFNRSISHGHRFGVRLDYKFSKNTSLLIQPQVNFGTGRFDELSRFETLRGDAMTNQGFSSSNGRNRNVTTNGFMLFRQRLGIPGRTLSFFGRWNYSQNKINGYNQSLTNYFDGSESDTVNQYYDRNARNRSLSGRLVYTEPLGHDLYLEGNYSINWNYNTSSKETYDSGPLGTLPFDVDNLNYMADGQTRNVTYSNSIKNRSLAHSFGATLAWQRDKARAQIGISANPTTTHNVTIDGETEKKYDNTVWKFAPQAMLFYDFNDNNNIRLFYRGSSNQPSTQQLLAVKDNSNPLNISYGNPSLTPYFNHNLRGNYSFSNKKNFMSLRINFDGGVVQNPIVSASWYGDNGVAYSMPVNGQTSFNGNIRLFLNSPIAKSNFSVSWISRTSYSRSGSYVGSNFDLTPYLNADESVNYPLFFGTAANPGNVDAKGKMINAKFEKSKVFDYFDSNIVRQLTVMERLRFTYRSDNLEVTLSGRTRMSKPWYTISSSANAKATWNNQAQATVNWTIGHSGVIIKSDFDFNWYYGYTVKQPNEYIWNAEISKLLLKNTMTIALKAYDIFNQAKNLSVTDASNYHQEVRNNTLGRYIILSLTWRFGNFGKAGKQLQQRYGGGPGGGPRGMGGGFPGMGGGRGPR